MRTSLLSTDLGLTLARNKGVPDTITVSGVVYQLLVDAQGQKLRDATGQYLYAKKVS